MVWYSVLAIFLTLFFLLFIFFLFLYFFIFFFVFLIFLLALRTLTFLYSVYSCLFSSFISFSGKVGASSSPRLNENVLQAMVQLGGDEFASRKLLATLDQSLSESELLKQALAELGKAKLQ